MTSLRRGLGLRSDENSDGPAPIRPAGRSSLETFQSTTAIPLGDKAAASTQDPLSDTPRPRGASRHPLRLDPRGCSRQARPIRVHSQRAGTLPKLQTGSYPRRRSSNRRAGLRSQ